MRYISIGIFFGGIGGFLVVWWYANPEWFHPYHLARGGTVVPGGNGGMTKNTNKLHLPL
jgi:hypothetical protein